MLLEGTLSKTPMSSKPATKQHSRRTAQWMILRIIWAVSVQNCSFYSRNVPTQ